MALPNVTKEDLKIALLNNKNQITQEAMSQIEIFRANLKKLEEELKLYETTVIELLEEGRQPSMGRLMCSIRTTQRQVPKYKEKCEELMPPNEFEAFQKSAPISYSKSLKIEKAPTL
jgi:hypothetical protein